MADEGSTRKTIRLPRTKGRITSLFKNGRVIVSVVEAVLNLRVWQKFSDGTNVLPAKQAEVKLANGFLDIILPAVAAPGSSGNGGTQQFKVVSDGGDFWNCNSFDGTTRGSTVIKVAKPAKLRAGTGKIASEVIRGVTYTYAYAAVTSGGLTIEYQRAWTGSDGSSGIDYMTPPVLVNDIISTESFTTLAPATLVGVTWIYKNCEWATKKN